MRVSVVKQTIAARRDEQSLLETALDAIHADLYDQLAVLHNSLPQASFVTPIDMCASCNGSLAHRSSRVVVVNHRAYHASCGIVRQQTLARNRMDGVAHRRRSETPLHVVLDSLRREEADAFQMTFSLRPDPTKAHKMRGHIGMRTPGSLPAASIQKGSMRSE